MELSDDVSTLKHIVRQLLAQVEALQAENADLRRRLAFNSQNSHKPPASEGLSKKPAPAFAKEPGKKTGGQAGHAGSTLKMVATPDATLVHHAAQCPCCGRAFSAAEIAFITDRRQVFDLPEPRLVVTEHRLGVIPCCGQLHKGAFPAWVSAPVQYGLRLSALSSMLNTDYRMPLDKISQLLGDLYGCSYNESTAMSANEKLYQALALVEQQIKAHILESQVAHFDETGMRVEGSLHWFHTACTGLFSYLYVHQKRGANALQEEESLLKDFSNWAIHDCWASYFDFKGCKHALCNAHILRELNNLIEQGCQWAAAMRTFLLELYQASEKGTKTAANKPCWLARYQKICRQAHAEEPAPVPRQRGKPKNSKGRNLLNRLLKHEHAILAFAFVQQVPFTNNRAEQDIRCIKIKQKVAMSFRTKKGAQIYARIQGFIATCRKQKMKVFDQLLAVLLNQQIAFAST